MKVYVISLVALMAFALPDLQAQERQISGKVTSSEDTTTLPGVIVKIKGTNTGAQTDPNGQFKITVPADAKVLVFSSVGMKTLEVEIGTSDVVNAVMSPDLLNLDEVVITALGISREKKSLGYATQEISGDELTKVKSGNFVNQISGKVSGVRVKNSGNLGGSTNIIVRGATSIRGNNQALFVIDGVPMSNDVNNTATQSTGRRGYDYGNAISDINPDDIESINVLKGAAATALYGSRASRGVVIITTKKGKMDVSSKRNRFGVTLNSSISMGMIDKSTFPTYQDEYGAGYGPYYTAGPTGAFFLLEDINGNGTIEPDEYVVPYTEDASCGARFDPSLMVYQWDALVPLSKNYKKKTPWVSAGENGPISFFEKPISSTNGFALDGGSDKSVFRLSYSNGNETGIMPNSSLKRNNVGFNGSVELNNKLSAGISANYTNLKTVGRNETGYNDNLMSSFRQWMQTNVSYKDEKEIYELTKSNFGWNPGSSASPQLPIYWNNSYFQRHVSYQNDERDRFFGNMNLNYKLNEYIGILARIGVDQYSTLQEERMGKESASTAFGGATARSGYSRNNINFREVNFDLMVNYKKDINENFDLGLIVGSNIRRSRWNTVFSATNGGLVVPNLYSLSNSVNTPLPATESAPIIGVNGFFASASLGYQRFLYLDITARQDYSSTLPADKNHFFYPGVSGSFIFSEKVKSFSWLDFGKVRVNYAKVGNDAPFASLSDVYTKPSAFGTTTFFSLPNGKNNPELKPEISATTEAGLEMKFIKNRVGFDLAVYNVNTIDQILNVAVSSATGYSSKFVNAGKVQNKGIEVNLYGSPVKTKKFEWMINLNFSKNTNEVIELFEGVTNLQMAAYQGGVTLNATVGEALGTLKGTNFEYINGEKVVKTNGYYKKTTTTDNTIGNVNPDYIAGITNTVTYKSWSFSFLVDMQKGGSIWSVDMWYGMGTGLYPETVGNNDLGNPIRNSVANGGGIILPGVKETGEKNNIRVEADDCGYLGYNSQPNVGYIYDASYVKLREMALSYKIPMKRDGFFTNAVISAVGSNLWIIKKNLPYADPESGVGAGNSQGFQIGVMPTVRTFSLNVTLQF